MSVSIIIPTLNRHSVLLNTIKELLKQDNFLNEILIIDQSRKVPLKFFQGIKNYKKVRYFKIKKCNLPNARNYGIQKAYGEIIIFLDDDIIPSPSLIKAHLDNYKDPQIGGVAGRVISPQQKGLYTKGNANKVTKTGKIIPNLTSKEKEEVDTVMGANMSFRKEVIKKAGYFDSLFKGNAIREETDLSLRVKRLGYKIIFEPKAEAIHLMVSGGGTRIKTRIDWYFDFFYNEFLFFLKHFPSKYLPIFFLRKLRPILACIFYYGKCRPKAIKTPFLGFKRAFQIYSNNIGKSYPIKIAIDVREAFSKNKTGKGYYAYNCLKELAKIDNQNIYYLYTEKNIPIEYNFPNNFIIRKFVNTLHLWHFKVLLDMIFEGIDIIYAPTSYIIPFLSRKKIIPVIHDLAIYHPETKPSFKTKIIEKLILKRVIKKAEKIIVPSLFVKKEIKKIVKINEKKIEVVYEGVIKRNNIDKNKAEKILDKYRINKSYFLFVGTIEPRKNLINLIKAYKKLPHRIQNDYLLILIGKPGWRAQKIYNEALGNKKNVKFLGYLNEEELITFYKKASLFIYPSLYEGFGLPILEAMSFHLPIITSKSSSMSEIASNTAILVNPDKVSDITQAILKIIYNKHLKQKLIERGLKRVKDFSWKQCAWETRNIFINLYN